MDDADWSLLDRQALGAIRLSLTKNIAYNIVNEKTTFACLKADIGQKGCKLSGIKLCGAFAASTLLAAYSSKNNNRKKYGVVFLNDCRSYVQLSISAHEFGFYHSAISTSHEVKGEETLWDLAIENLSLTPSSSLKTSMVSVFEDPVIEISSDAEQEFRLDDCMGCALAHGVSIYYTFRYCPRRTVDDCACVYPASLHSREQMQEFIHNMKIKLIEGFKVDEKLQI
ncbi:uncharacterized protein [Rutidosis leptorrhynchoides]|uniref:uncharacterized protein n=1 Tax=Rutidosis leptorrhynchoides TaxID=125765 RepID=UPI003A992137